MFIALTVANVHFVKVIKKEIMNCGIS